jgi:hypothetical protein
VGTWTETCYPTGAALVEYGGPCIRQWDDNRPQSRYTRHEGEPSPRQFPLPVPPIQRDIHLCENSVDGTCIQVWLELRMLSRLVAVGVMSYCPLAQARSSDGRATLHISFHCTQRPTPWFRHRNFILAWLAALIGETG